jgi:hypothetical protein
MRGWKNYERNKGYNMIDLVITIAIMSILAICIAPSVIQYIDKSRKSVDVSTGEALFLAANLSACSSDDEIYDGWFATDDVPLQRNHPEKDGVYVATDDGHRLNVTWRVCEKPEMARYGYYDLRPVAWVRGKQFSGGHSNWENTLFKVAYDSDYGTPKVTTRQIIYTNGFLCNLFHEEAVGERDHAGVRKYDGEHMEMIKFKYRKNSGQGTPECWILYKRSDNNYPEVWIGDKPTGKCIRPIYRIYPDPCNEYR